LRILFRVTAVDQENGSSPRSGLVGLSIRARETKELPDIHLCDELEVTGEISLLHPASNPGERDSTESMSARGIRAALVARAPKDVTRIGTTTPPVWLWPEAARQSATRAINAGFPDPQQDRYRALTLALLLGEEDQLTNEEWDVYKRTGVVHALAVSGQHLGVLALFLWTLLRLARVPGRRAAVVVALLLLGYALLAGGRPPVLRAAAMVCAFCGGMILRRPSSPLNDFALGWLIVAVLNPVDMFGIGCQLSFLCLAVLYWGMPAPLRWQWFQEPDPLNRLIDDARPGWLKSLRRLGWWIVRPYLLCALMWPAVAPLLAASYKMVPVAAVFVGPPAVLLAMFALVAGFAALPIMLLCPPIAPVVIWPTYACIWLCDGLLRLADQSPLRPLYVGDVPSWWLWVFYLGVLAGTFIEPVRRQWRWLLLAGTAWVCVGLVACLIRPNSGELRCTFLAVGNGGCTVLETPDGRTLLYDAGTMSAGEVTRRQIAPFLWSRGIRQIDEVFLSHADLDHFSGVPALLDRFAVAQVTMNPSFADKPTAAVHHTVNLLNQRGVPVRTVKAGDRLTVGTVILDVLHPPQEGPDGNENARSMVLLVQHEGHRILLTGDLAGPGLDRVLSQPSQRVDVLMAPHHGSRTANTPALAAWAQPHWVISNQGLPKSTRTTTNPYEAIGAEYLTTWERGAITVRSHATYLTVETFR
jgi:competence protein ComEC